jgi:shikimate dehydrogenase
MRSMSLFGLIGHPLTHSFSKQYFENKFEKESIISAEYKLFDIKNITELNGIVKNNPEIGAVNTIKIDPNTGSLKGYNTDYLGFKQSIKPFLKNSHERALILGTGGASKAISYVLQELNINYLYVSRTPSNSNEIGYEDLNEHVIRHHQIIINTTPLGTFPNINDCPKIDYNLLTSNHLLYDLVYNPDETLFLSLGKNNGAEILNGLQMLKIQAERSWEIWNS